MFTCEEQTFTSWYSRCLWMNGGSASLRLDHLRVTLMIFTSFASCGSSSSDRVGFLGIFPVGSPGRLLHPSYYCLNQGLHHFLLVVGAFFPHFLVVAVGPIASEPTRLLPHLLCAEVQLAFYRQVLPLLPWRELLVPPIAFAQIKDLVSWSFYFVKHSCHFVTMGLLLFKIFSSAFSKSFSRAWTQSLSSSSCAGNRVLTSAWRYCCALWACNSYPTCAITSVSMLDDCVVTCSKALLRVSNSSPTICSPLSSLRAYVLR